jgi:hypothetical protein
MVLDMDGCSSCWVSSVPAFGLLSVQLKFGLGITGMSRDVSWGFYIANFTYLVGVAAGGVMVVLPYYLHDYKAYGRSPFWVNFWPSLPSSCACCLFWSTWGSPCGPSTSALPDAQFVLFYDASCSTATCSQPGGRLERAGSRAQRHPLPELAQTVDLSYPFPGR